MVNDGSVGIVQMMHIHTTQPQVSRLSEVSQVTLSLSMSGWDTHPFTWPILRCLAATVTWHVDLIPIILADVLDHVFLLSRRDWAGAVKGTNEKTSCLSRE